MKTALTQLEDWIEKYEKVNGTPTMWEIKSQIDMLKEIEKEHIISSHLVGQRNENRLIDFLSKSIKYFNETFTH